MFPNLQGDEQMPDPDTAVTRETLAAEVRAATAAMRPDAETFLRESHALASTRLAELRQQRDNLNELIREEVEQEQLLNRAVAVFDRARAKHVPSADAT